jgi:tRNA pseudouridine38-40 synthase
LTRIALVVQYLGTRFYGWQRQPHHRSVQADLETAIEKILKRKGCRLNPSSDPRVVIHAAGRTDTGVHAAAQVVHFDVESYIPAQRWMSVLNSWLPEDIVIRASAEVTGDWHARFSATYRRYRYTLYTNPRPNLFTKSTTWHYYHGPLDETLIQKALTPLVGRHHLAAFHRAGSKRPHSWVDVQDAVCTRAGDFLTIEVQASGFLYGMMRLLVGLLVQVGRGDRSLESFQDLWQSERRQDVKDAAPPQGLCLLRVGYDHNPFPVEAWYDAQPILSLPTAFPDPLPDFRLYGLTDLSSHSSSN